MAHAGAGITGAILLGIAIVGFVFPINEQGHTIPSLNDLCSSGIGQMAQALDGIFGGSMTSNCIQIKYMTYGIYGFGLIGIILIIVGAVIPTKTKENVLTCPYCNYVAV